MQRTSTEVVEPAIGTPPQVLDSVPLRLPVQAYMLSEAQLTTIGRARLVLVTRCLARYGVHVSIPPTADAAYGPRTLTDRRYGITDRALAARYGYGLGPRDPARQHKSAQPALGVAGRTALTGQGSSVVHGRVVPQGGCLGEAQRRLEEGSPAGADSSLPQRLQFQSFELSKRDSRVRRAFAAWSTCMAAAGYRYADPLAALGDPRFTGPGPASARAIAVASTDLDCKQRTNLVGIWFTVDSAYEVVAIHRHHAAFGAAKAALDRQAANAERVITERP